jgi:hypothetical protein
MKELDPMSVCPCISGCNSIFKAILCVALLLSQHLGPYLFFFFGLSGFELRVLHLLGKYSTT